MAQCVRPQHHQKIIRDPNGKSVLREVRFMNEGWMKPGTISSGVYGLPIMVAELSKTSGPLTVMLQAECLLVILLLPDVYLRCRWSIIFAMRLVLIMSQTGR